jgi:hypothetical protein
MPNLLYESDCKNETNFILLICTIDNIIEQNVGFAVDIDEDENTKASADFNI